MPDDAFFKDLNCINLQLDGYVTVFGNVHFPVEVEWI